MRALRAIAAATAILFASSCVSRYTIPTDQLQYLNGYNIHGEQTVSEETYTDTPYRLISREGEKVDYNSSKKLLLLGDAGQPLAPQGPFESISVTDDAFDVTPVHQKPVEVPLQAISKVELEQPDPTATTWLIIGICVGAGIALATAAVLSGNGGGSSTSSVTGAPKNAALK